MAANNKLTKSYLHVPRKEPFIAATAGQRLYKMAAKYPDKEMFVFYVDKERFTFKQLKEKSLQFAASLLSVGLKKGDTIALWGNNHSEWIIAFYACIQLGIVPVPLRLEFPHSRIITLMNKLQCKAIVLLRSPEDLLDRAFECFPEPMSTQDEPLKHASCPHLQYVIISGKLPAKLSSADSCRNYRGVYSFDEFLSLGDEANINRVQEICDTLDTDDPCCIYFTSGSTGRPKPVVHSHHAILNNVMTGGFRSHVSNLDCNWESVRFMIASSLSAVNSWMGTFLPVVRGSTTIVLFPTFNAQIMAEALQNERVTYGHTLIHHVHDLVNLPNIDSYDFSNLKLITIGGSIVPPKLRQKMNTLAKYVTNRYGMTEILMSHCGDPADPPEKLQNASLYSVEGLETKIVDEQGLIVAVQTVGEILVRGYLTLKYYQGDDEKTKEVKDNNRWIHTGDLGTMDETGYVTIKGRKKAIIIKEGVNLIPAELEAVLYKHPKVQAALVIGLPDERVGEEICACIRVDKTASPTEDKIREFCDGKVHSLLIPKYVLFLDTFPATSTGKFSLMEITRIAKEKFNID